MRNIEFESVAYGGSEYFPRKMKVHTKRFVIVVRG